VLRPETPESSLAPRLCAAGIQPSAQRLAIGAYVLFTEDHPSAEEVLAKMSQRERGHLGSGGRPSSSGLPMISRATVYNTLNLFVQKGLLRELIIEEGHVVFDPRLDVHHHFVDTSTGRIFDLPVGSVPLGPMQGLEDFLVQEVQVVVRGTLRAKSGVAQGEGARARMSLGRRAGRR
jgi:Fur family iron response transcriptional regulator